MTTQLHEDGFHILTLCAGNPPVTGEFHRKGSVLRSRDFFDSLTKLLKNHCRCRWFETQWCPCDASIMADTIDSRYIAVQYNTLLHEHNFDGKTSATLRTHETHPYLALTGELWVSFVSCLEKSDSTLYLHLKLYFKTLTVFFVRQEFNPCTYSVNPTLYTILVSRVGEGYLCHYGDVIKSVIASQITNLAIVYSTIYSDADERKHQSSASLAFVRGISPGTGEFPTQMASNAENASIWWRHHVLNVTWYLWRVQ